MLTQSELKKLLSYDPETGIFTWLAGQRVGKIAGTPTSKGYFRIKINRKDYKAHRLAWLYFYGKFPNDALDHINGIKTDNMVSNLRECNATENNWNTGIGRTNTSGAKGVSWHKRDSEWQAQISINGKRTHLGNFATIALASAVYEAKARELRGKFYREAVSAG